MDEPTIPVRPLTDTKPEAPQPKQPVAAPKPEPVVAFRPETAADAWLLVLAARRIEYLFANGGTDFAPVVEAYAKGQKLGWQLPQIVIVPLERVTGCPRPRIENRRTRW